MIFLPDESLSLWKEVKMKEVGVALLCLVADPVCPHLSPRVWPFRWLENVYTYVDILRIV